MVGDPKVRVGGGQVVRADRIAHLRRASVDSGRPLPRRNHHLWVHNRGVRDGQTVGPDTQGQRQESVRADGRHHLAAPQGLRLSRIPGAAIFTPMFRIQVPRLLRRKPGLSAIVVLMLASGIGALTITFGILNAALLRPPPFREAERLTLLFLERHPAGEGAYRERWSFGRFQMLADLQRSFANVASYSPVSLSLTYDREPTAEMVQGELVSASYFPVLQERTVLGRGITSADDDVRNPAAVAVLAHGFWESHFGGRTDIIDRTIRLNGVAFTVIGVAGDHFAGLSGRSQVWVPQAMAPRLTYSGYVESNENFISVVGRIRAGVSVQQARAELALLGNTINRALPSDPAQPDEPVAASAVPINEARIDAGMQRSLLVLIAAVALLHLLACANVINLLLGRAAEMSHESSVRIALGSSRSRLFAHHLGDGIVLALVAGAAGMTLAIWGSSLVTPPANVWSARNFHGSLAAFDTPAFGLIEMAFGMGLTILSALIVAVPPALSAFRVDVASGIRSGARGIARQGFRLRRPSARSLVVGVESALAMLLVVTAGLLIDSFQRMRQAPLGVDARDVLTFRVVPSEATVQPPDAPAFITRLLESVAAIPGIRAVSVDGGAPLAGSARASLHVVGRPVASAGDAPPVLRHYVGPDHFIALGIPLLEGRAFTHDDDASSPRVAVISQTAADRFWPGANPIGQRVWFEGGSDFDSPERSAEIVGIVGDVVYEPLDQRPNLASFYTPYRQFTFASRMFFARTATDPMSLVPSIRRAVRAVEPELAIQDVQPLEQVMNASWARHRFDALIFSGFGAISLLLAASGVFAVISYAVTSRRREFGIRMALGSSPGRVLRLVLRDGMVFPALGMAAGCAAALSLTRILQASLYGVSPQEPRVFILTAGLLGMITAIACLVPAWRATRVDPVEALRSD